MHLAVAVAVAIAASGDPISFPASAAWSRRHFTFTRKSAAASKLPIDHRPKFNQPAAYTDNRSYTTAKTKTPKTSPRTGL